MNRVYNVRLNAKIRSSQFKTTEDTVIRTTPQSCIDNGRHSDTNHKVVLTTEDTVIRTTKLYCQRKTQ